MTAPTTLILGAGPAGATLAARLRHHGAQGPIILFGGERRAPYQRGSLSKAWLTGEAGPGLARQPMDFYAAHDIDYRAGVQALLVEPERRLVRFDDWTALPYDTLVLAPGARPIEHPTPGAELPDVMSLRTSQDAAELQARMGPGARLAVIGAGYRGLEVAAAARSAGAEVSVFGRRGRPLMRLASGVVASFLQAYHEARGVRFHLGAEIDDFIGRKGRLTGLTTTRGLRLPFDVAVTTIGSRPNLELADQAKVKCADGIIVDHQARTSAANIFAVGDATTRPIPHHVRHWRLESLSSALEQAEQAACAIVGRPGPELQTPWMWSEQYDLKIQVAGLPLGADQVVVRGDPSSGAFAAFHLQGAQVRAVEAINAPEAFLLGRELIASGAPVDPARLADLKAPLSQTAA